MDEKPIEIILKDDSHVERPESKELRGRALDLVLATNEAADISQLPNTLVDLINQIIKPLFSKEHHSKLTSTGRKNLVNNNLPAALDRFSSDVLFDSDKRPLWKNGWTTWLLKYILRSYTRLDDEVLQRKTMEAHFHLLVPPILHQIDDIDISYKVSGCECLQLLCGGLYSVQSGILKRSGLTDVFVEALKNDFSLLPSLTPEDESITLYRALYPAFRSLVRAGFPQSHTSSLTAANPNLSSSSNTPNAQAISSSEKLEKEESNRQSYLTLLYRHQLLHSLAHLSAGTGLGSTSHIPLCILLVSQIPWIFTDMGLSSVVHLQTILPVLRNILSDPFGTASPELLLASAQALRAVVQTSWPRIRAKWWAECLRGVMNCWLNIVDDMGKEGHERYIKDERRRAGLEKVKWELKILVCLLEDVVGQPFVEVEGDLVDEEPLLAELFDGNI